MESKSSRSSSMFAWTFAERVRKEGSLRGKDRHDWHSEEYVDAWIARSEEREKPRLAAIVDMLKRAPFDRREPLHVLDVGAGHGFVSGLVLKIFPFARVLLQDYSALMLAHARVRLSDAHERIEFAVSDLTDPHWLGLRNDRFDIVVSSLVLHNLAERPVIARLYSDLYGALDMHGVFLNHDLFDFMGGVSAHKELLTDAGFTDVACLWASPPAAVLAACRSSLGAFK
jgi:SAM-dependent methyltransferase